MNDTFVTEDHLKVIASTETSDLIMLLNPVLLDDWLTDNFKQNLNQDQVIQFISAVSAEINRRVPVSK